MENLVSICIPVYNSEKYLEQCLKSALEQTYVNIEILVVDDCSTDSTPQLATKWQVQEKRIRVIQNDKNLGLVGNWMKCIREAKGSWIKFLFQDDYMRPDCVEKLYTACTHHQVPVSICSRSLLFEKNASSAAIGHFKENNTTLADVFAESRLVDKYEAALVFSKYQFYNVIGEPIVLFFHKSILERCGNYNPDLVQMVDYEFAIRAALVNGFYYVRQELVTFRVHFAATSNMDTLSVEKKMKRQFLEPVIMYHEYLFNPNFKLLRQQFSFGKQLLDAAKFYGSFLGKYTGEKQLIDSVLKKYSGMKFIRALSTIWQINQKIKKA